MPVSYQEKSVLMEAMELVSVLRAADALGIDGLKPGANLSPFREEKHKSFGIHKDGHIFKDYATGEKGGCWNFIELAKPEWSKGEIAAYIIELAGLSEEAKKRKPSKTAVREMRRRKRMALYEKAKPVFEVKSIELNPPWPDATRDMYEDGCEFLVGDAAGDKAAGKIAESRGWPLSWVRELADVGKLSYPRQPWHDAPRQVAFVVEQPIGDPGKGIQLEAVGMHQVYFDIDSGEKSWRFWPSKKMNGVGVIPYPFVLGDLSAPEVVVIHEGQWDAITWWGAAGFFDDRSPLGDNVACFGLRGVESIDIFLAAYGGWLAAHKPKLWLINDNDAAGAGFHEAVRKSGRVIPSFTDRLQNLGCDQVVNSQFNMPGVKDFNDAWKLAPQSFGPQEIYELMQHEGLLS